ncbi:M48 family metallopeptidase [Phycisphaerales bacterium AB-hyl4]|uniref:Protease HtpX homolog n=1 Tax=Natronomicrosphaera hydrolytica TaxID=3242702 RepID=A0ABV4U5L7_9BACT
MSKGQATIHAYPPGTTFHDLIRRNKRNSVFLVLLMMVLAAALFMAVAAALMAFTAEAIGWEGLALAGGLAVVVVTVASLWSYYRGGRAMLRASGASKVERDQDLELFNVVEELTLAAGLPMPEVYLIPSKALNAFATGRDPEHAAVAITTGLRAKLTRDEMQAVMAHELAHVRHYDIRLTMMVATLAGLIVMTAATLQRSVFYGSMGRRRHGRMGRHRGGIQLGGGGGGRSGKGGGGLVIVLAVVAVVLMIIAPILARMIQMAVSRQREYLADAGAVELTRHPQALASALSKLVADHTPLKQANDATAHAYIVNPILNARHKENWASMMSTHPPVKDRIDRILALAQ